MCAAAVWQRALRRNGGVRRSVRSPVPLALMRGHAIGAGAVRIGTVSPAAGTVTLRTRLGSRRLLDLLSGEQLPRICR